MNSIENKVIVHYSKNKEFWRDFGESGKLKTIDDFKKVASDITDVCFISGCGVGFLVEKEYQGFGFYGTKGYDRHYQFDCLSPALLEGLADGFFFDKEANAKMWYCCFRFAVENPECVDFWYKYKDTTAGSKFMGIMLGSKSLD